MGECNITPEAYFTLPIFIIVLFSLYYYSLHFTQHKKAVFFPLRISPVNVTKSAGNWIWSHLLEKSLMEKKLHFCAVISLWKRQINFKSPFFDS